MPIQLSGSLAITGSIVATGQITAQTLIVQTITSSVSFVTGSTKFGNSLSNTHQFTGSVGIIDNLNVNGTIRATDIIYANNNQGVVFNTASVGDIRLRGDNDGTGLDGGDYILRTGLAYYGNVVTDNYLLDGTLTGSFALLGAGVGAGTPQATLDVSGSTKIRGATQVTGSLAVSGSLTTVGTASFTGPVGIGTSTPTQQLQTTGDAVIRNAYIGYVPAYGTGFASFSHSSRSGSYSLLSGISGETYINASTGTNIYFRINNNDKAIIDSSGNFGIGTASPNQLLEVAGGNGNNQLRISLNADTRYYNDIRNAWDGGTVASNLMTFRIATGTINTTTEVMTLVGNGRVGIGTTSPAYKLDVSGSIAVGGVQALYNNAVDDIYLNARVLQNRSTVDQDGMYIGYNNTGTTNAHLRFYANGFNERMRIDASTGNVGIGTTAPEVKLDVKGTSTGTLTGMALFRDASTNGNGLLVRAGTGRVDLLATWISSGVNTDLTFTPTTSGGAQNEAMRITSAGNIGIGTTSPDASSLLDITSTTKGFLPPRMSEEERDNITSPAAGLMVFVTNTAKVSVFDGGSWRYLAYE